MVSISCSFGVCAMNATLERLGVGMTIEASDLRVFYTFNLFLDDGLFDMPRRQCEPLDRNREPQFRVSYIPFIPDSTDTSCAGSWRRYGDDEARSGTDE